jgi:hypothetical protein
LNVFRRITHVNAVSGFQADTSEGEIQRAGVGLLMLGVTAAYASSKRFDEAKLAELAKDAVAVSAGHQAKLVVSANGVKDLTSAGD